MLSVQGLGLHHSGNYLFQNVNFTIKREDKIGLVGKNGAGKSTLLRCFRAKSVSMKEM